MSLTIRPVTESDWPTIAQLYPVYMDELPNEGDEEAAESMQWVRRAFDRALAGERQFWLAYDGEQLVGFTIFGVFDNFPGSSKKYAELIDFYIVSEAWRKRQGTELARAVFDAMCEAGASAVELNVLRENHGGLAFWQSLGLHLHHHVLKMPLGAD